MIYLELFFTFFKIGLFTFGGGYAMIPMIQQSVVAKGWLTVDEVMSFVGIAESTPGPFAINIATFVGMSQSGIVGAVCTTLGVVMPSFIIIYVIAKFFGNFMKNKYFAGAFSGIRPIIAALIGVAFFEVLLSTFFGGFKMKDSSTWANFLSIDFVAIIIAEIAYLFKKCFKKISPILLIVISALLGMGLYSLEAFLLT